MAAAHYTTVILSLVIYASKSDRQSHHTHPNCSVNVNP